MSQKYAYVIGICGAAMSAIALWLKKNSYEVFGCDDIISETFKHLSDEGINICIDSQHCNIQEEILNNKNNVLVTYSPAVHDDHPKLKFFRENGFKIFSRKEFIQKTSQDFFTISIAGTHGKTTTTAMVTHLLYEGHCDMVSFIGGKAKNYDTNLVTYGNCQGTNLIIEADEFDNFFLCIKSNIEIITNVDGDHYDTFGNIKNYREGFKKFLNNTKFDGLVIMHKSAYEALIKDEEKNFHVDYYDINDAPIHAENIFIDENNLYHFDYVSPKTVITDLVIGVPGEHNIKNALAAITVALYMKVNEYVIREGLKTFLGVKKRFDIVMRDDKHIVIDDYAHHPVEIYNVLMTIKKIYPGKKITAIFRPNQYSRTKDFLQQFAESLDLADQVIIVDIFTDREKPIEGISNHAIIDRMSIQKKIACGINDIVTSLKKFDSHEIVVNLGAGDSETFIDSIIAYLMK